jgi:hypothetical protein
MTLSSASTLAQVQAAYDDNLDYDLEASIAKARAFIQAARMLLRRTAEEVQAGGGERIRETYLKLEGRLKEAERWLRGQTATMGSGGSRALSLEDYDR